MIGVDKIGEICRARRDGRSIKGISRNLSVSQGDGLEGFAFRCEFSVALAREH